MSGVNDKPNEWFQWAQKIESVTPSTCADQLMEVARTAWHPAREPPTEQDADKGGLVMAVSHTGVVGSCSYIEVDRWDWCKCWARIRDVVLMPPEAT